VEDFAGGEGGRSHIVNRAKCVRIKGGQGKLISCKGIPTNLSKHAKRSREYHVAIKKTMGTKKRKVQTQTDRRGSRVKQNTISGVGHRHRHYSVKKGGCSEEKRKNGKKMLVEVKGKKAEVKDPWGESWKKGPSLRGHSNVKIYREK